MSDNSRDDLLQDSDLVFAVFAVLILSSIVLAIGWGLGPSTSGTFAKLIKPKCFEQGAQMTPEDFAEWRRHMGLPALKPLDA